MPALVGQRKKVEVEIKAEDEKKNKAKCRRSSPGSPSNFGVFCKVVAGANRPATPTKNHQNSWELPRLCPHARQTPKAKVFKKSEEQT